QPERDLLRPANERDVTGPANERDLPRSHKAGTTDKSSPGGAEQLLAQRVSAGYASPRKLVSPGGAPQNCPHSHHADSAGVAALPSRPNSPAMVFIASMQVVMCWSRSMPNSAAPRVMSSRLTLRAKALSFIFLRTERASTSASDLLGLTSVMAVMNPASSSQAKRAFSRSVWRGTPL